MADVLEVYQRPPDPTRPLVWLDESSKQLLADSRAPLPMQNGRPARSDYEYKRNGTANLLMVCAPLEGRRYVKVTDRRTAVDYAYMLEAIAERLLADAETIILVQDNLNTHKPASLYEVCPAEKARRLVERCQWHYTPKHRSWLNLAESELGILSDQCLDRRIPDQQLLAQEIKAWPAYRHQHCRKANWQFTTADARIRLRHLYPTF